MVAGERSLGPWSQDREPAGSSPALQTQTCTVDRGRCNGPRSTGIGVMIINPGFVGIDISKAHLDVFESSCGTYNRVPNTSVVIASLVDRWRNENVLVVFEATGHYDRPLRRALADHGIRFTRVNPARARDFARSAGFLAKTDAIDARMLAAMAQCLAPQPQGAANPVRERLALAHKRRDQLVHARQKERTRRSECVEPDIATDIDA